MQKYQMQDSKGFEVIHDSSSWRIAVHTYEKDVNGLEAFQSWGIHEDSQEAFVLQKGQACLVTSKKGQAEEDYEISPLQCLEVYLVEKGEPHAILLKEGSLVLIMENQDMRRSHNILVNQAVKKVVHKFADILFDE